MLISTRLGLAIGLTVTVTLSFPALLPATGFRQFDRMKIEAQSEFVAVMIDTRLRNSPV